MRLRRSSLEEYEDWAVACNDEPRAMIDWVGDGGSRGGCEGALDSARTLQAGKETGFGWHHEGIDGTPRAEILCAESSCCQARSVSRRMPLSSADDSKATEGIVGAVSSATTDGSFTAFLYSDSTVLIVYCIGL